MLMAALSVTSKADPTVPDSLLHCSSGNVIFWGGQGLGWFFPRCSFVFFVLALPAEEIFSRVSIVFSLKKRNDALSVFLGLGGWCWSERRGGGALVMERGTLAIGLCWVVVFLTSRAPSPDDLFLVVSQERGKGSRHARGVFAFPFC